jgi:hypothetical protein
MEPDVEVATEPSEPSEDTVDSITEAENGSNYIAKQAEKQQCGCTSAQATVFGGVWILLLFRIRRNGAR